MTAFNVWVPQGNVVTNPSGGVHLGNPSVIYDTNPVVLTGQTNVFKMWAGDDLLAGIYYFESVDGLTSWTAYSGNPILPSGAYYPTVYKVGSTFYLYANITNLASPTNTITAYTSTDGVTFTSQGTALTPGASGWDSEGLFQMNLLTIQTGTWYAYYSGDGVSGYGQGYATSSNGISWTKSVSNPIFPAPIGNMCFLTVGSTYYAYASFPSPNATLAARQNNPLGRWSATAPGGPWTSLTYNSVQVPTYYVASPAELNNGTALPGANANDQRMCVANGNVYLYYTYTTTGGTEQAVYAALASGMTPSQLVATYEGVFNVPFTGLTALNLATLGTDNFTRANVNPLGGNWTPRVAGNTSQILSNVCNASVASTPGDSYWNAVTWPADQWAQVTINNETNGSFLGAATRTSTGGVATSYRLLLIDGTGSSAIVVPQSQVAGTANNLATIEYTVSVGDTLMAVNIGTSFLVYWNGYLIGNYTDASIATGAAGFELQGTTSVTNSGISGWSGGGLQASPLVGGGSGWMNRERHFVNKR